MKKHFDTQKPLETLGNAFNHLLSIKILRIFILLFFVSPFCAQDELRTLIENKMKAQEEAWNNGDLHLFMEPYWHSDSLVFVGKSGPTYGWQATLDNYLKGYPSKEAMGILTFENINLRKIDSNTFMVIGFWNLNRLELENLKGSYSLIWQKKDEKWVIIADHSS